MLTGAAGLAAGPQLLAIMEKTRMYIFRGMEPEEPVLSSGYLCAFSDLQITAVLLDDMMAAPDQPDKDLMIQFETKALRDTRQMLGSVGADDAYQVRTRDCLITELSQRVAKQNVRKLRRKRSYFQDFQSCAGLCALVLLGGFCMRT
jgi:hypothetical protein